MKLPCRTIWRHLRNPHFVGRQSTFASLRKLLQTNFRASQGEYALWGVGGVGKTQVANRFVLDSIPLFPSILWTRADRKEKLLQSFSEHTIKLGAVNEHTKDPNMAREALLK